MRRIDADELKKAFAEYGEKAKFLQDFCQNLINNAPTVETKTTAECIIAYGDGYETARRLYERPQGEWIFDSEFKELGNPYGTYRCNKCGGHSSNKYPFCFWCGASMVRGGET